MRCRSTLILCLCLASFSAARADVPADLLLAAPSGASGASAPAGPASGSAVVAELFSLLRPKGEAARLEKASADERAAFAAEVWAALQPHERATLDHASARLREGGSLVNQRTAALIALGSPVEIYDEPSRDWSGQSAPVLGSPLDLMALLKPPASGGAPPAPATSPLSGSMPTQAWVYPGATVNDQRVLWFVDEGADGTWRFVRDDKSVPVTTPVSTVAATEMPAELFPSAGAGVQFEPLPALTKDVLPVQVAMDTFKASASRTFARLMPILDPADVDLELGVDPAAYQAAATAWIEVKQGGAVVFQSKTPLASLPAGERWLAEFGVPLVPGAAEVTALVIDDKGNGGKKAATLEVPAYSSALAISSMVLARADAGQGEAGLPKAAPAADGSLAPFQIGNYIVRPQTPPVFKRGDTIVLVVQVYGASKVSLEYDLYREGVYQNTTDPTPAAAPPLTDIQQFTLTDAYTDGAYEFRVTAKGGGTEAAGKVSFRVKG